MATQTQPLPQDAARQMLRHTVATLAYRGGKALRGAPDSFAEFRTGEKTRTPAQILAHIGDVLDWALSQAQGKQKWQDSPTLPWQQGTDRFFAALAALDAYLGAAEPLGYPPESIFQGAIADALTHVGQIAMLRRLAGCPIKGENYSRAKIEVGRVGAEQPAPVMEFE
ncbi:MAG: hypothetical protein JO187_11095 [Acidobacteria bacterium]|nr:hypothetical protein [Acidobacteriota bacterium]